LTIVPASAVMTILFLCDLFGEKAV